MARKTVKASDYTHSVWSGEKYDRPQTQAELTAESMKVLRRNPTIGRLMAKPMTADELRAICMGRKS
jgi:hypothetical protein